MHTGISSSSKFPVSTSSNVSLKCVVEVEPYTDCANSGRLKWLLNNDWSLEHGNTKKYEMQENGTTTICKKEFIVTIFKVTEKDVGKYSCRWLCPGVNMATSSPIQLEVFSSRTGTNTFAVFNRYLILIIKIINSLRTSSLRHSGGGVKEEGELWVASQNFVFYRSRK